MIGVLVLAAILPSIVLGLIVYNKDNEKEPLKLLIKVFFGGIGAIIITLLISDLLFDIFPSLEYSQGEGIIKLLIYTFLGIALVEEFSKWLFTYSIGYKSKEFDHVYDAVVYAVFVALGFATIENILYVLESNSFVLAIFRAVLSVPVHAFCGVLMGYYLGLAKTNNNAFKYKFLSILVPVLFHGAFDACIFIFSFEVSTVFYLVVIAIIFLLIVVSLYILAIKQIKNLSSVSNNIIDTEQGISYCDRCGSVVFNNYTFCNKCGNLLKKQ